MSHRHFLFFWIYWMVMNESETDFNLEAPCIYKGTGDMPCLGCRKSELETIGHANTKLSFGSFGSGVDHDARDIRLKNAASIKKQLLLLPEELSSATYGLDVEGVTNRKYTAQDFFTFYNIIGCGQMGVVFRADFKPKNEAVAIKFIPEYKQHRVSVMRELSILKMAHKCRYLIRGHSTFRVGPSLYFVSELCEGGSFQSMVEPSAMVPPQLARIYMSELAIALFFLHSQKIMHRDISLKNCVLTSRAHLRLIDYGLCRTIEEPAGEMVTDCGNAAFRAPEMYLDRPCTCAVDWWSAGILLYRFITGHFPFQTEKLTEGYHSVTKLRVKFPPWLFEDADMLSFCQGLLSKNPKSRLGYTDEKTAIQRHPFFNDIDWDNEMSIENAILEEIGRPAFDRYSTVYTYVMTILGMPLFIDRRTSTMLYHSSSRAFKNGLRLARAKSISPSTGLFSQAVSHVVSAGIFSKVAEFNPTTSVPYRNRISSPVDTDSDLLNDPEQDGEDIHNF